MEAKNGLVNGWVGEWVAGWVGKRQTYDFDTVSIGHSLCDVTLPDDKK
jgi:hypothetical protein